MSTSYPAARIQFEHYNVKRVQFELSDSYNDPSMDEIKLDFELTQEVAVSEDYEHVLVTLGCDVFPDSKEAPRPFRLLVELQGFFTVVDPSGEQERLKNLIATNTIAIMFPYLRSTITNITSAANVNPLILPTINVAGWIKENTGRKGGRRQKDQT